VEPEKQPLLAKASETTFAARQRILNEHVCAAVAGSRLHKQTGSHGNDLNTTKELLESCFFLLIRNKGLYNEENSRESGTFEGSKSYNVTETQ
jgi:hypothetical protein